MIKIGITGSIASGKTTASKIISKKCGPLFIADKAVKDLYFKKDFKKLISKKFKIEQGKNFKVEMRKIIFKNKKNLKILEKIIHPLVRMEMFNFQKKNRKKKFLFFEIPLLVENKLYNYFNTIIYVKCKKAIRLKRYLKQGGSKELFNFLNNNQLKDNKKSKYCDHIVVNNSSLTVLKRKLLNIIVNYE